MLYKLSLFYRPPACLFGFYKDGKQEIVLQWPNKKIVCVCVCVTGGHRNASTPGQVLPAPLEDGDFRPQRGCPCSEVATISLAWDETTSSTRKAGRGWDCQLG